MVVEHILSGTKVGNPYDDVVAVFQVIPVHDGKLAWKQNCSNSEFNT